MDMRSRLYRFMQQLLHWNMYGRLYRWVLKLYRDMCWYMLIKLYRELCRWLWGCMFRWLQWQLLK